MIQAENLFKRYGEKLVLDDVSFCIGPGEIVGLLGLNGAGKTTTMNILTGCIGPSAGRALINGFDMVREPRKAKQSLGFLPEQPAFYAGMRVREYLNFICDLKRLDRGKAYRKQHIGELCEKVGLLGKENRLIRNLSKGYRQRVSFAQALAGNPAVLIMDEPTVGLDPSQVHEIRALIREQARQATVLISSHILPEIREMCQRVMVLRDGLIIADDSPQNLAEKTRKTYLADLRVKASKEEAAEILGRIPGIMQLMCKGSFEEGTFDFHLALSPERDARLEVFEALAQAGLPLLQTYGGEASLEDIFLHLVGGEGKEKT